MGFLLALVGYILAYALEIFIFFRFSDLTLNLAILAAAYWLSLARLPHVSSGRVWGEVVGAAAAFGLIAPFLQEWLFSRFYGGYDYYFGGAVTVIGSVIAAIMFASVAFGLALIVANWPTVRRLKVAPTSIASYMIAGACLLGVIVAGSFYFFGFYAYTLLAIVFIVWASVGLWRNVQAVASRAPLPHVAPAVQRDDAADVR